MAVICFAAWVFDDLKVHPDAWGHMKYIYHFLHIRLMSKILPATEIYYVMCANGNFFKHIILTAIQKKK